jgi:2-iminoacetate synthase ThiH
MPMLQNDTKYLVPATYFRMFNLRLLGLTYAQIAEKTGYLEAHIRRLFAKDGALYNLRLDLQKDAFEEGVEDDITMMFGHLPDITRALIMQAKNMQPGAVKAAEMIFNYTLDQSSEKTNLQTGTQEQPLDPIKKEQILTAFRNFNLIKNDN